MDKKIEYIKSKLQEDKKELIQKVISENFKNESLIKMLSKEELINLITN